MPGFIGPLELILGGVVALILFGPKGLSFAARAAGKGIRDAKAATTEVTESVKVDRKDLKIRPDDDERTPSA